MTDSYISQAMRTNAPGIHSEKVDPQILHAAIGLSTEAGELLDAVKKSLFYGKDFDRTNAIEELGDIFWYLALGCEALGVTFEEVQATNIAKLRARYPERFKTAQALSRDLEKEREILEAGGE